MALHINLYNEIQKEAQDRARDPFKLAMLAGILVLALFAGYYFYRVSVVHGVESKFGALTTEWKKLEPEKVAALVRQTELLAQQKANQALLNRLRGRFYWGPFLEQFAETVPETVQISGFNGVLGVRGQPISVLLTGIAAGEEPLTVAEGFRRALEQKFSQTFTGVDATFDGNSLEAAQEVVQIHGKSLATARFRIRLVFKAAPPAPAAAASASPTPRVPRKPR